MQPSIRSAPFSGGVPRPAQELPSFEKLALEPGETKRVTFALSKRAFAYYNTAAGDWAVECGVYELRAAAYDAHVRRARA